MVIVQKELPVEVGTLVIVVGIFKADVPRVMIAYSYIVAKLALS